MNKISHNAAPFILCCMVFYLQKTLSSLSDDGVLLADIVVNSRLSFYFLLDKK